MQRPPRKMPYSNESMPFPPPSPTSITELMIKDPTEETEVEEEVEEEDEEEDVNSSNSNSNSNRHLAPMVRGSTAGHMERVHTQEPNAQRKMKATKTMQPSLTC